MGFAGFVFWLLALLSVASVFIFLSRLLSLRRAHIPYSDFIKGVSNLLERNKADEALVICDETQAPVARIVGAAVRHRKGSARALREAVDTTGRVEVNRLERRLATLAIIAQIAPLIGLTGTVLGLIQVLIALNMNDIVTRGALFSGAMQALTATAAGLIVAIFAQVMYGVLRVWLDRLISEMEASASEILAVLTQQRENRVETLSGREA